MPNNNIFKALINVCMILLLLYSITTHSFFTISHYSYTVASQQINIYIEQQFNESPLKINLSFSNPFFIFYIFNSSKMNITYSSSFNSSFDEPIIFYNRSMNVTVIKVNYMFASNMTIILVTSSQYVKIIGNSSIENVSITLPPLSTSTFSKSKGLYFNYLTFLIISIVSVVSFIVLKRYKGY